MRHSRRHQQSIILQTFKNNKLNNCSDNLNNNEFQYEYIQLTKVCN